MTNNEAISVLNRIVTSGNRLKAISMGVRALKKEEPVNPTFQLKLPDNGLKIANCGVCHKTVLEIESYCPSCGQRIKW